MSDFYGMIRSLETRGGIFESYKEIDEFRELLLDCEQDEIGERIKRVVKLPGMSLAFCESYGSYVNRNWSSSAYASPVYAAIRSTKGLTVGQNLASMSDMFLKAVIPQLDIVSAPIPLWAARGAPAEFMASSKNKMSFADTKKNLSSLVSEKLYSLSTSTYSSRFEACISMYDGKSINSSFSDVIRTVGSMISFLRGDVVYFRSGDHIDDEMKKRGFATYDELFDAECSGERMRRLRQGLLIIFEWCGLDKFLIARAADQNAWINRALSFAPWQHCPSESGKKRSSSLPIQAFPTVPHRNTHDLISLFNETRDWTHYEALISGKYPQG